MQYESEMKAMRGQAVFMFNKIMEYPEPDRSVMLQNVVEVFNKKIQLLQQPTNFVEVVNE